MSTRSDIRVYIREKETMICVPAYFPKVDKFKWPNTYSLLMGLIEWV